MLSDSRVEARRLRILSTLVRLLSDPVNRPALFDQALAGAADLVGAVAGSVRILDRHEQLVLAAGFNLPPGYEDRQDRHRLEVPELLYAFESSGPACFGPGLSHPALRDLAPDCSGGWILSPVALHDTRLGLITLFLPEPRDLSEAEFLALRCLTEMVAVGELNYRAFSELERASRTDPLTGLSTRRHFDELLRRELSRARRHDRPLSLALLDVDHLKQINDRYGHAMGDQVLALVGDVLQDVRATDLAVRLGGDEFLLLMPDTTQAQAELVCERFQQRLQAESRTRGLPFRVSVSVGVRELGPHGEDLVAEADAEMYRHKRQARKSFELQTIEDGGTEQAA